MKRYLLLLLLIAGCGQNPARGVRVAYDVSPDGLTFWDSNDGSWSVADYPNGVRAWWECGLYEGQWRAVCVEAWTKDGRFIPADQMPVTTAACFDESLACP